MGWLLSGRAACESGAAESLLGSLNYPPAVAAAEGGAAAPPRGTAEEAEATEEALLRRALALQKRAEAATVEAVFEAQGDMNPWHHHIELRVVEGELKQGDRMVLYCKGWDAPTFITYAARFLLLIKNVGEGDWMRLADPDPYDVVADAARRLVVIAEAEGGVGEEVSVRVWRGLLGQSGALGRGAGVGRGRCSVAAAFAAFSRV